MALKTPDMTKCTLKKRCLGGVNDGLAYDPADACESGQEFNVEKCDCETTRLPTSQIRVRVADGSTRAGWDGDSLIPSPWKYLPPPYYDTEGRLVQTQYAAGASGLCNVESPAVVWASCPLSDAFATSLLATKVQDCIGGSGVIYYFASRVFVDGTPTSDWVILYNDKLTVAYGGTGGNTYCYFPNGFEFTATLEWEQQMPDGSWVAF